MKRQLLTVLATLSLLITLAAAPVRAQSDLRLRVSIPFEFTVGDKTLPAGEYVVKYVFNNSLMIQSADGSQCQAFLANATRANKAPSESSLVFNRYGDQYFLSTIWTTGNEAGLELRKPDAERELIRARIARAAGATERQKASIASHR